MMTRRITINIPRQRGDPELAAAAGPALSAPEIVKIEQKTETCQRFHTDWAHYIISLAGCWVPAAGQTERARLPSASSQLKII